MTPFAADSISLPFAYHFKVLFAEISATSFESPLRRYNVLQIYALASPQTAEVFLNFKKTSNVLVGVGNVEYFSGYEVSAYRQINTHKLEFNCEAELTEKHRRIQACITA